MSWQDRRVEYSRFIDKSPHGGVVKLEKQLDSGFQKYRMAPSPVHQDAVCWQELWSSYFYRSLATVQIARALLNLGWLNEEDLKSRSKVTDAVQLAAVHRFGLTETMLVSPRYPVDVLDERMMSLLREPEETFETAVDKHRETAFAQAAKNNTL